MWADAPSLAALCTGLLTSVNQVVDNVVVVVIVVWYKQRCEDT
jgi:hypothetical protein